MALSGCTRYFHIILLTVLFSGEGGGLFNIKCVFWFSLQFSPGTFQILRKNELNVIINVITSSYFDETRFSKNSSISNFMDIRPVGAEVFHADGQTDGRTQMTMLIVANAPPKNQQKDFAVTENSRWRFSPAPPEEECSTVNTTLRKVNCSRYRPCVAQRVGRGIALLFHDRGTRREWVVSSTPRPHFTAGKDPVPILQEAVWAPGVGLDRRKISSPLGFDPAPSSP